MSYPEPIKMESAERLYKQARFFYDQYEKEKGKREKLERENARLKAPRAVCPDIHCEKNRYCKWQSLAPVAPFRPPVDIPSGTMLDQRKRRR